MCLRLLKELLEELVSEFDGTILLVSHDRAFLDNVATSTLVFEGDGMIGEFVGGYSDWVAQKGTGSTGFRSTRRSEKPPKTPRRPPANKSRKLGYNDKRELEALPARIEALESEQTQLQQATRDPGFYRQDKETITSALNRLDSIGADLETAYARWEELDAIDRNSGAGSR